MTGLSRRVVLGAAGAVAAASVGRLAAAAPARPNILWLVSEDNNPWIGAYGDRLARTPHIDALAQGGLLFRNAFSTAPVCAPSRFSILTGMAAESNAPANHMRARATLPPEVRTYPELLRAAGYYCTNNAKTDYNCDVDPARIWDATGTAAHWRNRPAGKPFMAVFNFQTTHESRFFAPVGGHVQPAEVRIPAYLPDTPAMRRDFATYYNLIERMDAEVGAKLAELDAAGHGEDTIVFYYSDNGGVLPRSKRYCTDEGLRCALVVRVPPKWAHLLPQPAGTVVEAPVTFLDLAPTLLTIADQPVPRTMQGQPLLGRGKRTTARYAFGMRGRMDERYDMVRTVADGRYRYVRNYLPYLPLVQNQAFAWLAKGYQDWDALRRAGTLDPVQARAFEPRAYEEFYDLAADPDETDNRIADPAQRRRIAAMRRALDRRMIEIVDNGFIPEGAPGEGYRASRVPGAYPLRRIMALAQVAARRDPRKLAALRAALADDNPTVRWWGATGLAMLGEPARPALPRLLDLARADPVPQVRIAAAEAAARLGRDAVAVAVLEPLLAPAQPMPVRLQAINVLTRIGPAAASLHTAIAAMAEDTSEYLRNAARFLLQQFDGSYDPRKPIFDLERVLRNPPG